MEDDSANILRYSGLAPPLRNVNFYYHLTERWAENFNNVALIQAEDESCRLTYGQLHDVINKVSRDLKKAGLQRGGVVSVWCTNSFTVPIATLASMKLGAVPALLGASLTAEEALILMKKADVEYLVVDSYTKERAAKILPHSQKVFSFEGCDVLRVTEIRNHGESNRKKDSSERQEGFSVNDPALILFSSGTTGLPKAVELSHGALDASFTVANEPPFGRALKGNVASFLPLSHIYGILMHLRTLWSTATFIIMRRFKFDFYLQLISKYKCQMIFLVPAVAAQLIKNRELVKRYDLSSVVSALSSAAPLQADAISKLTEIFSSRNINFRLIQNSCRFLKGSSLILRRQVTGSLTECMYYSVGTKIGYGMTEIAGACSRFRLDADPKSIPPTAIGQIIPYVEIKIRDLNTGRALPAGQEGEILVRGKFLMNCYKGDPAATAETIDSEGWLHTGDVGYYDKEGYLFIVDRIKELIKHKGMQVAPAELEDLLMSREEVLDAAVVGEPDELTGEKPVAFIVKRPASSVTEKQLVDFVAERVAGYKQLTGGVRFIDSIPRVPNGKILRRTLKEILKNTKSKL